MEAKINRFQAGTPAELRGEAVNLHCEDATATWQITLRDGSGAMVAIVLLTQMLLTAGPSESVPLQIEAARDDAGPRDRPPDPALSTAGRRREQIAAAASDVIARKGFSNATMKEIAEAAGLHVPTMYQYVASKDEMLELVYNWIMASIRTDFMEATAGCVTAAEKLRAVIAALIDKGDRYRHRIGALNRELRSLSPPARRRVLGAYRGLLGQIGLLIEEGVAAGEFRPVQADIAANFVEGACDMWALRQFAVGHLGRAAFHRQIEDLLMRALQPAAAGP